MPAIVIITLAVALTIFLYRRRHSSSRLPLPPGPPPKFFIGNADQLPKKAPWKMYARWAETYGPIFSFRAPNKQFIVLNTLKSATELLDRRAYTYSDRPTTWMHTELAKRKLSVFNVPFHHPYFKAYRTMLKASLSPRAIQSYQRLQIEECQVMLNCFHKNPEEFAGHIKRNVAAIVLNLAYGWRVTRNDDYFIRIQEEAVVITAELKQPGRWLVEAMPILRFLPSWFPGASFKRVAFDLGEKLSRLDAVPFQWVKQQIQSGNYIPSFTSAHLLPEDGSTVDASQEETIRWCSQGIYGAGVDTTASAATSFVLAMMLYPAVQQRAQAEINNVVGKDRFPTFEDRDKLPYIAAIIQEILRWAPPVPEGLAHRTMKEDVYEGYRIPEGATILANIFTIARDGQMYPDPLEFRPERFLGPSSQIDPHKFVFGFGRRACPGVYFAEGSLYLIISCILAAFTISKPLDESGKEMTPSAEFDGISSIGYPKPFKCRFIPRNEDLLATFS